MADLLQEYKDYYRVRAERYANNPNYKHSYEAEQNLSAAMQGCSVLEEFRERLGNLNEKCANALIKDKYLMEKAFYDEHQEIVRVKAADRILEKVDSMQTAMDVASLITEETNKNSIEISMDESNRELVNDWKNLEMIEIYEKAEAPADIKAEMRESAAESKKRMIDGIERLEKNNNDWQEGWRLNPDAVLEHRHRRFLVYKDEHVQEMLQKYKSIINR